MSKPRVFVTRLIPEVGLDLVRDACEADIWSEPLPPPIDVVREKLANCEGLLSLLTEKIDADLMDALPGLKVVSNYAVGFNNIDIAAATQRGICVGNTPGVLTEATADLAFTLLISAARRVVEGHRYTVEGKWKTWEPRGHVGQDLMGKTLGIVGMGRIGYALAKRCRLGWDMQVLYHDPRGNDPAERDLQATRVDFDTLLAESDFISVHADLNETTKGMFDRQAFRRMKSTAVFVNTARGPLVNEADLTAALQAGEIFSAGLDVTDPEPPQLDNPLLQLENVIVLPHIASATISSRNGMARIAAHNLIAGIRGEPLPHWVNPEVADHRRT